jgi:hypothetical protein
MAASPQRSRPAPKGPSSPVGPSATERRSSVDARPAQAVALTAQRIAQAPTVLAAVLGVACLVAPLYLFRRPRVEPTVTAEEVARAADEARAALPPIAPPPRVQVSAGRIVSCQEPSPRRGRKDECDRLPAFEEAFARAVEQAAGCVPASAGGGTIEYLADVSFARKAHPVTLIAPKQGRTIKDGKIAAACQTAIKRALGGFSLEGLAHRHGRYKIAFVATYPAPSGEPGEPGELRAPRTRNKRP